MVPLPFPVPGTHWLADMVMLPFSKDRKAKLDSGERVPVSYVYFVNPKVEGICHSNISTALLSKATLGA